MGINDDKDHHCHMFVNSMNNRMNISMNGRKSIRSTCSFINMTNNIYAVLGMSDEAHFKSVKEDLD